MAAAPRSIRSARWGSVVLLAGLLATACGPATPLRDPLAVLQDQQSPARRQIAAMNQLDALPQDEAYLASLRRVVVSPAYTVEARKAAFERLYEFDREGLQRQLSLRLPREENELWRTWVCEQIAARGWTEMTATLIRAWAAPRPPWMIKEEARPERVALERLYGEDRLVAVLLRELVESDPIVQANLRMRCWELLRSIGREEVLRSLLADRSMGPNDPMLRDLRLVAGSMGVLPRTREEILWARAVVAPRHAAFRARVEAAVAEMPQARLEALRMRDLGVAAAARLHRPDLLTASDSSLYAALEQRLAGRDAGRYSADFEGYGRARSERLADQRRHLDWGDLAALHLALDAVDVSEVRRHLFDIAERDLHDRTTEYGGVISLDDLGRFEVLEFPPRARLGDHRYESPPELFEALHAGLYHFHMHCQQYENRRYAGPHLGDFQFADSTGANCLVFTFIDSRTLNVDWYRHGEVVVDLGTIHRPSR
jgi:hypothetical protein